MVRELSGNRKHLVFPLSAAAILALTGIISGVTVSAQNEALEQQQSRLSTLNSEVAAARAATNDLDNSVSVMDAGANAARVADDTEVIGELLESALTWDDDASYREARERTMRRYGLAGDSPFMTSFLPEAPVNIDSQGNEYPYIDAAGLNSQVGDYQVKLLSVDAVNYAYMVLIDVQARSSDGLGTAVNVATAFVTIDGEGAVSQISGFPSTTPTRTSG
jgi:hypothetical protein